MELSTKLVMIVFSLEGWKEGFGQPGSWAGKGELEGRKFGLRTDPPGLTPWPSIQVLGYLHWGYDKSQHLLSVLCVPGPVHYLL